MVTGANAGIGLETVKQLALLDTTTKVYMACRTESKALAAIDLLVDKANVKREKLAYVHFDISEGKEKIALTATHKTLGENKLDGLILNAGSFGDANTPTPCPPNNVLEIWQCNLVGHIHLVEALRDALFLSKGCRILISASESARGVALVAAPPPKMGDTVGFYKDLMTGVSYQGKRFDTTQVAGEVKGTGALFFAAWARRNPSFFVLTVSPGGTKGTSLVQHGSVPWIVRKILPLATAILGLLGYMHSIPVAAKRYVDATTGEGEFKRFTKSGMFIASAKNLTGPVDDQTNVPGGEQYGDEKKQEAMYEAMQTFL